MRTVSGVERASPLRIPYDLPDPGRTRGGGGGAPLGARSIRPSLLIPPLTEAAAEVREAFVLPSFLLTPPLTEAAAEVREAYVLPSLSLPLLSI